MHRIRITLISLLVAAVCVASDPGLGRAGEGSGFHFAAYGEGHYSHFDYGPDQKSGPAGSPADSRAIVDIPRLVLEFEYRFRPNLAAEAELEWEHLGAGTAVELEYEEFGEYDREVESGGEAALEQLHLTYRAAPWLSLRGGRILLPIGLSNQDTSPLSYLTVSRSESESSILPVTWFEMGIEAFGRWRFVRYRAQVVNALDSSGFSSQNWIVGGHQRRFEQVRATDLAWTGLLETGLMDDLRIGIAGYRGDANGNRPKPDMDGIDGTVTILEAHARLEHGPWIGRVMALRGTIDNADQISAKNARLSNALEVPRTPVAREARLAYLEAGFDVLSLFPTLAGHRLIPFLRIEEYDAMADTDPSIFPDPRFERTVTTVGIDFRPAPQVALKADYAMRSLGSEDLRDENTVSVGFAFSTD